MTPLLSDDELKMLRHYLPRGGRVLEWGSGGSTVALSPVVGEWHSIEHNPDWHARVSRAVLESKLGNVRLYLAPVDVDPFFHGAQYPPGYVERFRDYVNLPTTLRLGKFDLVLVDGRARLACAELALSLLAPGGLLAFHDFYAPGRERYAPIMRRVRAVDGLTTGNTFAFFSHR